MQTTLFTKALGAVTTVTLKKYGDGTLEFVETTAGGPVERSTEQDLTTFLNKLFDALNTVANV